MTTVGLGVVLRLAVLVARCCSTVEWMSKDGKGRRTKHLLVNFVGTHHRSTMVDAKSIYARKSKAGGIQYIIDKNKTR